MRLLRGKYAIMNMIPYNTNEGLDFRRPDVARSEAIARTLHGRGVLTTLRQSAGQDVDGGCGQLRARGHDACARHPHRRGALTPRRRLAPHRTDAMHVLLVEDDAALAESTSNALRAQGWRVDHTPRGEPVALSLQRDAYDLLILDIGLPGIDGFETLRRVRERRPVACPR